VAHLVWERFGPVANYVEPFFGSGAVLLARPDEPRVEAVNDLECHVANFWRAVQADPEKVAYYADSPVNEADLHARHLWLTRRKVFRERMKTNPRYYNAMIAGWWVWGISQWIGSGWCAPTRARDRADGTPRRGRPDLKGQGVSKGRSNAGRAARWIHGEELPVRGRFDAEAHKGVHQKRVFADGANAGRGVHTLQKRPYLSNHGGGRGVHRQLPDLSGDSGAAGRGVHSLAKAKTHQKMPQVQRGWGFGVNSKQMVEPNCGLLDWFSDLAARLRRVRVCCGDWSRIVGPAVTTCIGTTGVFLDPPYSVEDRDDVYNEESRDVAHEARVWALANGDNPLLRIALCGYEGEHDMPDTWECIAWKSSGGYGSTAAGRGRDNAHRERIWFSPACLTQPLFRGLL